MFDGGFLVGNLSYIDAPELRVILRKRFCVVSDVSQWDKDKLIEAVMALQEVMAGKGRTIPSWIVVDEPAIVCFDAAADSSYGYRPVSNARSPSLMVWSPENIMIRPVDSGMVMSAETGQRTPLALNAKALDHITRNQSIIPKEWGGRGWYVYAFGTVFSGSGNTDRNHYMVRCLRQGGMVPNAVWAVVDHPTYEIQEMLRDGHVSRMKALFFG